MAATKNAVAGRAVQGRRWSMRPLVLLMVLTVAAFLLPRDRTGPVAEDQTAEEQTPEPLASGAPLLPTSDLIYRVPARLRPSCKQLDTGGIPVEAMECSDDLSRATYFRYADVVAMDAQFEHIVRPLRLPDRRGGCRAGRPSRDIWRYTHTREKEEGRMACFLIPPDIPATVITQPSARLLQVVVSNPSVGWGGHFERWTTMVPNPPPDQAAPTPPPGQAAPTPPPAVAG
ncbi:MAG TPA: hypothetical protein VHJ78_12085 [Actinomycetota bacterium]|nr:hypothetical protein [Actinomycetota bacterium]